MKKQMIFTLALLFASLVSVEVMAQGAGTEKQQERQRPMMQNRMHQGQKAMNVFTEEQKTAMKQLRLEHMEATTPLKNELNELKASQKSLMSSESPDQGQINAVIDKITQINGQLLKERAAQQIDFRSLLTDEQRIRMDAMRANGGDRGARMGQGQQRRRQNEVRGSMMLKRQGGGR